MASAETFTLGFKNSYQTVSRLWFSATSDWCDVTSGVSQGSVLDPFLFVVFINDLPDCVSREKVFKLFAYDSKLLTTIKDQSDVNRFQSDLLAVGKWTRTWQMEFNIKRCKHMRFSPNNDLLDVSYYMKEDNIGNKSQTVLTMRVSERELEFQVSSDLKNRELAEMATAKENIVFGMLRNSFTSSDPVLWKRFYTTYVRPHLEFSIQAWNPYMKGTIETLEQFQSRITRIQLVIKKYDYAERCRILGLTSLKER